MANSRVLYNSSLHIVGVFVAAIRDRFTQESGISHNNVPGLQWLDDDKETGIYVESGLAKHRENFNTKPTILVNHLQSASREIVTGNRAGVNIPTGYEVYFSPMEVGMQIDCQSKNKGESAILGDQIQIYLLATKHVLRKQFGFNKMSNPVLGRTTPIQRDTEVYNTPVTFSVQVEIQTVVKTVAPALRRFRLSLSESSSIQEIENSSSIEDRIPSDTGTSLKEA